MLSMAADANIKQVEDLVAYVKQMNGFVDSVSRNCTSLQNLMVQKLDALRKKLKQAMEMEAQAVAEYQALLQALAYCPADNVEERQRLLAQKSFLENRKLAAVRMREQVLQNVNIAQGATYLMIDLTSSFKEKTRLNMEKGMDFVKRARMQLQNYNERNNQL